MSLKIRTELPRASRSRSPLEWKKHCLTVLKAIDLVFTQDDRRESAVPAVSNKHQAKEGISKKVGRSKLPNSVDGIIQSFRNCRLGGG